MTTRFIPLVALSLLVLTKVSASATVAPENGNPSCAGSERVGVVQQLAKVINSRDDSFHCVGLTLKDNVISAIRFETHRFTGDHDRVAQPVKVEEFPVGQIESKEGAVLEGQAGHDAIILQGQFARPSIAANLNIRYLHNGITGEYRSCTLTLGRGADRSWHLVNDQHQDIKLITVRTWKLPLLGTAGIANLDGICQAG